MGTHPIFESDFDCLTECCHVVFVAAWTGILVNHACRGLDGSQAVGVPILFPFKQSSTDFDYGASRRSTTSSASSSPHRPSLTKLPHLFITPKMNFFLAEPSDHMIK